MDKINNLYKNRFNNREKEEKKAVWEVLCKHYFNRFISGSDRVLEIGAGYCEFINNIVCKEKFAVDLNEDIFRHADPDVNVFNRDCSDLSFLSDEYFDKVFVSNFFEHLPSKQVMDLILGQAHNKLKHGGEIVILQPNIKYLYDSYWDFYDHSIPLSHLSMVEALEKAGFIVTLCKPKFLPYTVKSRIPKNKLLVLIYLKMPWIKAFLGKQMLLVAQKQ